MMKYIVFLALSLSQFFAFSQEASIAFARFQAEETPYLELAFHVSGQSLTPISVADSTVQGAADVLVLFQQGEEIISYDKFRLNSPAGPRIVDFIDLKRYPLDPGTYTLQVEVTDANAPEKVRKYVTELPMELPTTGIQQSDIQLLAKIEQAEVGPLVKNGVLMEPLPYNFYGRGANTLFFYHEVYNSQSNLADDFMVSYLIQKMENGDAKNVLIGHKRQSPAVVNPLLLQMDITAVPSGNYRLTVEVRDRERNLVSTKSTPFQRSNPRADMIAVEEAMANINLQEEFVSSLSAEELEYGLRAISPIIPQQDAEALNILLAEENQEAQRMYLMNFWIQENRLQPKIAYEAYMEVARAVDNMFNSGFRRGFETDRGYIYLKYGQPNDIVRNETEPSAPPYEIWSYNEIERTNQNNVRFIFYNPSLAADDFLLLHSDVIGERNNPQWQMDLYRNSPGEHPQDYFQGTDVEDNIGRRSRRILSDY